jgi:hypothetical protein
MNTAPIIGKHIASAYLHVDVINSAECASATPTELWHVGWVDANTTWNNQPGWVGLMDGINRTNNAAHCPGERGADFNAVGTVQAAADQGWAWTTLMLKAAQEGNTSGWRRFDLNPYLVVKYNSYPNPPRDLGVQGWGPNAGDALPCRLGAARPAVSTRTPKLRARFTDPDGGKMDGGFRLYDSNNGFMGEMYVKDIYSGGFGEVTVPVAPVPWITQDGVYKWNVWNGDGQFRSESPNCEFEVDSVKPNTPLVSSTDYPATGVHGVAGRTGSFTFKTNGNTGTGGTMDVRRYGWSINNNTATTNFVDVTSADGTVTLPITPPRAGTNTLHVTAFDRATNRSATNAVYVFQVAEPTGPTGSWALDETSGTTAADAGSGNRPLTLAGNASFGSGYAGNALVLNGTGGYASTATPVVDTSRAFTISAWAKPTTAAGHLTVVGQDAPTSSPFYLQYTGSTGRWTFTTIGADNSISRVAATTPTRAGAWTHLLGVYRPDDGRIDLYVDGRLEGTGHAKIRPATGNLVVGASIWNNARTDFFGGSVDKVRVWDRALNEGEAAAEATATGVRAHYQLDERSGTTTRDEVTGQQGTLSGGAAWAGDTSPAAASTRKWLNFGTSGAVTAPRPADLRTDRSYSVSAWVRLTSAGTDTRAAVSMGDGRFPPFLLLYQAETRRWGFLMTQQPDSSTWWIAQSDNEGQLNGWVHLVGTYDSVSGRIALYVDGVKQTVNFSNTPDGGGVTGWNGTGPLSIGRGRWDGQAANPWQGDVDDVRVHSGVLTSAQVTQLRLDTAHS